jgi:hypothetical protein
MVGVDTVADSVVLTWAAGSAALTWAAVFSRGHFGGPGAAFGRGFAGQHFAVAHGRFGHDRHFGRGRRFAPGLGFGFYDYGCSYGYPYYNRYGCYTPEY